MGTNVRFFAMIAGLLIAMTCSAASADKVAYYTDSCVEQESGDVAGYVVIVNKGEPLPSISLSWSEGALKDPVAAKVTYYDQTSGRVAFSASIEWNEGERRDVQFEGKFGPDRMAGTFVAPWNKTPAHVELKLRSRKAAFEPSIKCH